MQKHPLFFLPILFVSLFVQRLSVPAIRVNLLLFTTRLFIKIYLDAAFAFFTHGLKIIHRFGVVLFGNQIGDASPLIQQRIQELQRRVRFMNTRNPISGKRMNNAKVIRVQVLASG